MQRPIQYLILVLTIFCCQILEAQPQSAADNGFKITASGYTLQDAGLDAGGDWSTNSFGLKLGKDWQQSNGDRIGVELQYAQHDHSFSSDFSPWGDSQTTGLSLRWTRQLNDDWSLYVSPSIELSRESGADSSDSIGYGTLIAFNRFYSRNLQVGYGLGIFAGLEDTSAFPLILIRWQIDESWYLGNPFTPGPVGPAGLELGYRFNENWSLAFGSAYRSNRFKLDDKGTAPGGFGETEAMAVFLRSSHTFDNAGELHIYAGTLVGGELSIDDATGKTLLKTDFDPSLLFAIAWQGRF